MRNRILLQRTNNQPPMRNDSQPPTKNDSQLPTRTTRNSKRRARDGRGTTSVRRESLTAAPCPSPTSGSPPTSPALTSCECRCRPPRPSSPPPRNRPLCAHAPSRSTPRTTAPPPFPSSQTCGRGLSQPSFLDVLPASPRRRTPSSRVHPRRRMTSRCGSDGESRVVFRARRRLD